MTTHPCRPNAKGETCRGDTQFPSLIDGHGGGEDAELQTEVPDGALDWEPELPSPLHGPAIPPVATFAGLGEPGPADLVWTASDRALDDDEPRASLKGLPNELILHVLSFLEVCDLLSASRTCHRIRHLALAPILHTMRLRRTRAVLPPLLLSPPRPSLADLIARSIFLTHTTVVSRKLARSLVSIRLSRRLAARPSLETLVERCVLPAECVPGPTGSGKLAPGLVAKKRAIERERLKDGLRSWIGAVWKGEVRERGEGIKRWEERSGTGRVWRLRKFWERVGRGDRDRGVT